MAKPKRTSIAARNAASYEDPAPAPDAKEETPTPAKKPSRQTPAAKTTEAPAPKAGRTRRTSVYLGDQELKDARSAYLQDFDHRPGSAHSFGRWAADAVAEFAQLSVKDRQKIRKQLGEGAGAIKAQQIQVSDDVAEAVADAMRQDRAAGFVDRSRNVFNGYALRWQSEQARQRAGLEKLPEPPERLPLLFPR